MTATALFQYKNLDSTKDLNARFAGLFGKGVYAGGRFEVNAGANAITVTPYTAMTLSGMAVFDNDATTVTLSGAGLQYIVIDAAYNETGPANISVFATTAEAYNIFRSRYILLGTVDMDNLQSSYITAGRFGYAHRDQISPVQDSKFLGWFGSVNDRDIAYPDTVPTKQRIGDFVITGSDDGIAIGLWTTLGWIDFGDPAKVGAALSEHVNDLTKHTTPEQHAAIAGSDTEHAPSATNRFVTESDTRILSLGERKAIKSALGAGIVPVGEDNVLVSADTAIAVPRVFQVTTTVESSVVDLTLTSLSVTALSLYLGKQAISNGVSSAQQYFGIEDSFGAGFVSTLTNFPVFVTNVLDGSNGVVNPQSVSDDLGFLAFGASSVIRLQLSTRVPAGSRFFIRLNVLGDLHSLTPNWSGNGTTFLPALTAFRNARASYVSGATAQFDTLTVGPIVSDRMNLFMYSQHVDSRHDRAGIAAHFGGTDSEDGAFESGFFFERTRAVSGTDHSYEARLRANSFRFTAVSPDAPVESGFGFDDNNGLVSYQGGIWSNVQQSGGIDHYGRVVAVAGQNGGLGFGRRVVAGETVHIAGIVGISDFDFGEFKYDSAIGLNFRERTGFVFSSSPLSSVTDTDCPFVFHQDFSVSSGNMNTYIGPADADASGKQAYPGLVTFGYRSYSDGWQPYLELDYAGLDAVVLRKDVHALSGARFLGRVTNRADDEQSPSFSFTGDGSNTGMFYIPKLQNDASQGDELGAFAVDHGIGFSVDQKAVLVIGKIGSNGSVTGNVSAPLVLAQRFGYVNSKSTLSYDFSLFEDWDEFDDQEIRFGSARYTGEYLPSFGVGFDRVSFYRAQYNESTMYFGGADLDNKAASVEMQLNSSGLMFRNYGANLGRNYGVRVMQNGGMWVGKTASYGDTGFRFDDDNGIISYGSIMMRANSASSTHSKPGIYFGASDAIANGRRYYLRQTGTLVPKIEMSLGAASNSNSRMVWGFDNDGLGIIESASVSADGVFRAAYDIGVTYGFHGPVATVGGKGFGFSTVRDDIEVYGDLGLRNGLKLYDIGSDWATTPNNATVTYGEGVVKFSEPISAPNIQGITVYNTFTQSTVPNGVSDDYNTVAQVMPYLNVYAVSIEADVIDAVINVMTSAACVDTNVNADKRCVLAVHLRDLAQRTQPLRIFIDGSTIAKKTSVIFYTKDSSVNEGDPNEYYILNSTLPLKGIPQFPILAGTSQWKATAPSGIGALLSDISIGGIAGATHMHFGSLNKSYQTEHLLLHPRGFSGMNALFTTGSDSLTTDSPPDLVNYVVDAQQSNMHNTATCVLYKPYHDGQQYAERNYPFLGGWWLAASA